MRIDGIHSKIGAKFELRKPKRRKSTPVEKYRAKLEKLKRKHKKDKIKFRKGQALNDNWQRIEDEMRNIIQKGNGTTEKARLAYGVLLVMQTGMRVGNQSSAKGYVPVKTEFVKIGNKFAAAKRFDEKGRYLPIPEYESLPKYIRHGEKGNQKFVLAAKVPKKTVKTFGLTTIQNKHVYENNSGGLTFHFIGKKAVQQHITTNDDTLVRYHKKIVGNRSPDSLYLDITAKDLKQFIKKKIGKKFTPKDLRTVVVNLKFIANLRKASPKAPQPSKKDAKRIVDAIIEKTAEQIGHTKGVCKGAYLSKSLVQVVMDRLYPSKEK